MLERILPPRPLGIGMLVVWAIMGSTIAGGASAAVPSEPGFYTGGKFYPLIRSETEFAVEFASVADREAVGQKMRANQMAIIEDVPWRKPGGKLAILRLPEAASAAKMRLSLDAFESVHRVFRIADGSAPILSSGNIVVRLQADVTPQERDQLFADYRVEIVTEIDGLPNAYVVRPRGDVVEDELPTANHLYHEQAVRYAHPDFWAPFRVAQFDYFGGASDAFHDSQ